jgi:hypothetical protein
MKKDQEKHAKNRRDSLKKRARMGKLRAEEVERRKLERLA